MPTLDCRLIIEQLDLHCNAGPSVTELERLGAEVGSRLGERLQAAQRVRARAIARGQRAPGCITIARLDVELGELTPDLDADEIAIRIAAALEARLT